MAITQHHVAERAGVSRALVSLVMRDAPNVSADKRERVLAAAAELGYRRNTHAAQLASRQSKILGVVLPEVENTFAVQVLRAIQNAAEDAGYGILLSMANTAVGSERHALNQLLGHRLDGVVLLASRLPAKELQDLSEHVPIVLGGRSVGGVNSVCVDDNAGARMAMQHLLDLGHTRIAHVTGGQGPGAQTRRRAYTRLMTSAGFEPRIRVIDGDYSEPRGVKAGLELLSSADPPTAIFAANDLSAIGVLAAAKQSGLSVPSHLSVVGFDDAPLSGLAYVDLTTIHQPRTSLGIAVVETLLDRAADDTGRRHRVVRLPPRLVIRGTTAHPRQPERSR